jgi:putative restriction endonuclease
MPKSGEGIATTGLHTSATTAGAIERLGALRLHQSGGRRSPHKPLLVLLALGRLQTTGTSAVPWSVAEDKLAELITEYGPPSKTASSQSAAYPFTRLTNDGVWELSEDVPMDLLGPLQAADVVGDFEASLAAALRAEPEAISAAARALVDAHFPESIGRDVLVDVGLDPDNVYAAAGDVSVVRRRSAGWRIAVLKAWDRQCAFCGFDGMLAGASVGIEAAHVRWFNHEGPDDVDNGLALCALHHQLFDRGVLGLSDAYTVLVSDAYSARTDMGRAIYDLHGTALRPRPGTSVPAAAHRAWHTREVFKGAPLAG